METAPSRPARRYESRPGRLVVVIDDLHELQGPISGTVELPNRLLWQPDRAVDLDDAWTRSWMYALVLREARRRDDLRTWINRGVLLDVWPTLNLPRAVRAAWEDRHPALRPHTAAARWLPSSRSWPRSAALPSPSPTGTASPLAAATPCCCTA